MSEKPLLIVDDLSVSWEGSPILESISFTLDANKILCLIGRSGSGKTTLFHALAGLTLPDSGEIRLDGQNIAGKPGHVGYMLQKDLLLDSRTIIDNVILPLVIKGMDKQEARSKARPLLASFGLQSAENKYPRQLSGGMRQRAALLRTYLTETSLVLMDEPFSALDALTRQDMQAWFLRMADELSLTSIIVTHDINEALALGDEILLLGPVSLKDGPAEDVSSRDRSSGEDSASTGQLLPSTIVDRLPIDVPRGSREDFLASAEAAQMRQRMLAMLGGDR